MTTLSPDFSLLHLANDFSKYNDFHDFLRELVHEIDKHSYHTIEIQELHNFKQYKTFKFKVDEIGFALSFSLNENYGILIKAESHDLRLIAEAIAFMLRQAFIYFQYLDEQKKATHETELLHQIVSVVAEKKSLARLLDDIMSGSKLLVNADASSLLLYEAEDKKLYFQIAQGSKGKLVKQYSVELGSGIAGWVGKHKESVLIKDCYEDIRFNPEYDKKTGFRTKSMICVPLLRKKKLVGVMQVINKKDGSVFSTRDLKLFETLASQVAISIENARLVEMEIENQTMDRELEVSKNIQEKLLPQSLPIFNDLEIAATLVPAKHVGGDYYNVVKINENETLFIVVDVTGKGIPAALIVSTISAGLLTYLQNDKFDLLSLVKRLNTLLMKSTTTDKFASCWFGLYHHDSRVLKSINAGHNPPYLIRHKTKKIETLKTGGIFLGGIDFPFEMESVTCESGDIFVFFTDGVTEAWNKKEEMYGEERFEAFLLRQQKNSPEKILKELIHDIKSHVNGAKQSDDITCGIVKINSSK